MAKKEAVCECSCSCGMHFCKMCAIPVLIFGILFLIAGLGLYTAPWYNGWTILGVFLGLAGLVSLMKKM